MLLVTTAIGCAQAVPTPTVPATAPPKPTAQAPAATVKPQTTPQAKAQEKPQDKAPQKATLVATAKETQKPLDPPVTVVAVTLASVSDAGFAIAEARGYFAEEGLKIERKVAKGGVDVVGPMATGEIDVAGIAPTPGFYNAAMRDVPIKIVADKAHIAPGRPFTTLVVRKDLADSMKELRDMKGKNIAVNAIRTGNSTANVFRRMLKQAGLTLDDINAVDLSFPETNVAMSNKAVDLALQFEPLLTQGLDMGLFVNWKGFDEVSPNLQVAGVFYSPKFAKTEAAKRFMVAYLRGVRDFNDGLEKRKNWDAIVSILQEYTALKDRSLFDKMAYAGLNPNGYLNVDSMVEDVNSYIEQGFMKEKLDVNKVIDMQYVDYALARLGKYQP